MAVHEALVGTYTRRDAEGIYNARFDSDTGRFEVTGLAAELPNPSYLAQSGEFIYAVLEEKYGLVTALRRDGAQLTELNRKPTLGAHPCHLSVVDGQIGVANYSSGSVSLYCRAEDGSLGDLCSVERHAGHGPNKRRQSGPHAHMAYPDPWASSLLVPDLGCDRLYRYSLQQGALELEGFTQMAAGSGPRHVIAHPTLRGVYYVVNELDNTIARLAPDADHRLTVNETVSALPSNFKGQSATAALRIHPTGNHLYATNRGADCIVCVGLGNDGSFGPCTFAPSGGEHPRDLVLDPTGQWLLVANQDSDSLRVYALNSGVPAGGGTDVAVPVPVCVLFVDSAEVKQERTA